MALANSEQSDQSSKLKALTTGGGLSAAMESETQETKPNNNNDDDNNEALINAFREITSSSREVALFFLESHNFDLDAAVSTFLEDTNNDVDENNNVFDVNADTDAVVTHPSVPSDSASPPSEPASPDYSPTRSRSRSASPKSSRAPYELRSRREKKKNNNNRPSKSRSARGNIRSLADLNRPPRDDCGSSDDSDEPQDYYTGGEKRYTLFFLFYIFCEGFHVWLPRKPRKNAWKNYFWYPYF